MSLSKRSNAIPYMWFTDKSGKTSKISCRTAVKQIATEVARSFLPEDAAKPTMQECVLR